MKTLILFSIAAVSGLLGLIITRTYKKNRAAILFYTVDILLLTSTYYLFIDLYHIFAYIALLFLFVFILSIMRLTPKNIAYMMMGAEMSPDTRRGTYAPFSESIDTIIKYISLGHLAVSSILVSVFLLPEIYHSIPIAAGLGIAFLSFVNLNLVCRRREMLFFDRLFLYVLYIKVVALALALNPFFTFKYPYVLPLSSLLVTAAGIGVLLKGQLFIFRVRPSAEVLWKSLLLITLIIYGVILVYLDRYSPQQAYLFYLRIFLVSAFIIIAGAIIFSRAARNRIKFFMLRHLYASRYDLLEIFTKIFSLHQKGRESINFFIKEVLNYFFENYPFSGIEFLFSTEDEKIEEKAGEIEKTSFPLRFTDESGTADIAITFYSKVIFDEDDKLNLRLIAELIFRMASDMYLTQSKVFREKLEIAERLKLFFIHDLKNICHTLNMLEKNISRVQPSETEEFMNDFRLTVPHLVKRAEKILNTIGMLREGSNPEIFSLKEVVKEILNVFHKKKLFSMRFEDDDRIYADRATVMIAVENILRNAHDKSFEHGDFQVSIEGRRNNEYYTLYICDNGTSIAEDVALKIFNPFFTTKKGGIGVGLYQTKEFLESQGGSVNVENMDSGVCFTLKLPAGHQHLFK
jgi:signal transduction histidine kinase